MLKNPFLKIGAIGFAIVLLINLFVALFLQQPSAIPFQADWYSIWLPSYMVWFVFLTIGIAKRKQDT